MRRLWLVGAAVASLALSACGATATINQAVTSLGASPDVQVHLSMFSDHLKTPLATRLIDGLSMDLRYASTTGQPLSDSVGHARSEITINYAGRSLVDMRAIDHTLYLKVNVDAFAGVPGVSASSMQLAAAQLLLGGRWFSINVKTLTSLMPSTTATTPQTLRDVAASRAMTDAIVTLIESTPYRTLPHGGYSETGTLKSVVAAIAPALHKLTSQTIPTRGVKGSYHIGFTMSGSVATGATLSVTVPHAAGVSATLGIRASLTHERRAIDKPTSVTVISRSLLEQLVQQAQGLSAPPV
jgi:hypothetical protein